jgi:YbbR domain-containing protein
MKVPTNQIFFVALSIGLSFLLWLWVGAQERSEIAVSVPLEYRNLPRGLEILPDKNFISSVNVWVKGTSTTVNNLLPSEISAWVDLSKTKSGLRNFELGPDQVRAPYGFSVLRINPSHISLRIEEVVTRSVPVTPRLEGEPPLGYALTQSKVTPAEVNVRGPQSAVASVRQAFTDSIDISTIHGTYSETTNVGVENSSVRIVGTNSVQVFLNISEIQDVYSLRIPISTDKMPPSVKFNPKTIRVDLMGPKTVLADIKIEQIHIALDVEGLKPGVYELTPQISFDPEIEKKVSVKDVIPERVHVRIP